MPDTFVHDALVAYTDDAPPMTLSSDRVIAAGRRRRNRHRAGLFSATAVVLALAVTVTNLAPNAPPPTVFAGPQWTYLAPAVPCAEASQPADPQPSATPSSVLNKDNGFRIPIPNEQPDHAAARFTCFLMQAVPLRLPAGTLFAPMDGFTAPGGQPLEMPAHGTGVSVTATELGGRQEIVTSSAFIAVALVGNDREWGKVEFDVFPQTQTGAQAAAACRAERPPTCTVTTRPHGEIVLVDRDSRPDGFREIEVQVYRGTEVVAASAANGAPLTFGNYPGPISSSSGPPGEPTGSDGSSPSAAAVPAQPAKPGSDPMTIGRPDPPMGLDDLIALASAPQLTLFP